MSSVQAAASRPTAPLKWNCTRFEVAIPIAVIERAILIGKRAAPNEWCGTLLGHVARDTKGLHVVVVGLVLNSTAVASPGFVETTHVGEAETRTLSERLFPDAVQVGWAHGHLNYGARFSETDKATQRRWSAPYALGIVFDPFHNVSIGVYRGPETELLTEVTDESPIPPPVVATSTTRATTVTHCETRSCGPAPRRSWKRPLMVAASMAIIALVIVVARRVERDHERLIVLARREEELEGRLRSVESHPVERVVPLILIGVARSEAPERPAPSAAGTLASTQYSHAPARRTRQ